MQPKKKKRNRTCEECRKRKKDVETVIDPYREDVFNEEIEMDLCKKCYGERSADI